MKESLRQQNAISSEVTIPEDAPDFKNLLETSILYINALGREVRTLTKTETFRLKECLKRRYKYYFNTSKFQKEDMTEILKILQLELGKYLVPEKSQDDEYFESDIKELRNIKDWLENKYNRSPIDEKLGIDQVCLSRFEISLGGADKVWFLVAGTNKKLLNARTDIDEEGDILKNDKDECRTQWNSEIKKHMGTRNFGLIVCYSDTAQKIKDDFEHGVFITVKFSHGSVLNTMLKALNI
jgi:hypothetical protein